VCRETSRLEMPAKRALDLGFTFLALICFVPLFVVIAVAIKLDDGGSIFFIQRRLGRDLKVFPLLKFRSMVEGAETLGTGLNCYEGDPRITRCGHFLRRTSLDELPQLLNILRGDMSLVGPRPAVVGELGDESLFDHLTRRRFCVRPGVTGLAQISGRDALDWPEKIRLDNQYIDVLECRGVLADIPILLKTVLIVLSGRDTYETRDDG
jgi:undecaprenyl phosphate N,N'-diacetylbacillosamine 1-phosphate transferase